MADYPNAPIPEAMEEDGRCPECSEDEMDGGRCLYCGYHNYNCEMPDCERCSASSLPQAPSLFEVAA